MVELAVIRLTRPETSEDHGALLARLERLERGAPSAAPARPANVSVPSPPAAPETSPPAGASTPAAQPLEPAVEATPPRPAANGGLTFEKVQEIWPSVFGGMRDVLGPRRWALFRETTPGGVEGSTIVLNVGHDFHLEALRQDPAVTALVATRAGDLLGVEVTIDFRSTSQSPEEAEEEQPELDKENLFDGPDQPSDPVDLLKQTLGATVVEEVEEEADES
jgi:hypothetical protein